MKYLGIDYSVRNLPELDPDFIPFGVWIDAYEKGAAQPLTIAIERDKGKISVHHTKIHGTPELAEAAAQFCREYHGAFLEHHGAVTWGADVMQALFRTESLEHTVTMYEHMLALGTPRLLTERQLEELEAVRRRFGITGGGRPRGREASQ